MALKGLGQPNTYTDAELVDLSTTDYLPANGARAIFVTGAGAVKVTTAAGTTLTIAAWPANTFLPLTVVKVFKTGTTATGLIAFA